MRAKNPVLALSWLCLLPATALQAQAGSPPAAPTAPAATESFDLARALREGGDPMSADQAAAIAVKGAPGVKRAQAASEQARAAASEALVAVYPRLDLEASYTRLSELDPVVTDFMVGPTSMRFEMPSPVLDQYNLQAQLSYPVSDLFLQILPRRRAAEQTAEAQALTAKAEAQNVALQAREAFYNYARARAARSVAQASLAQSQAQRRDVEALVAAGTVARVEQMRADANMALAEVALARADGAVAVARTALQTLLHRDTEATVEIAITDDFTSEPPVATQSKVELFAEAQRARPELLALRTMSAAHDETLTASEASYWPKLSVAATYDFGNPNRRASQQEHEWIGTWALMGVVRWSPNDLAAADAKSGQVAAQRDQTEADLLALLDALRLEVGQAYEDYRASSAAMKAAQTGILAAEESYRVRREQFRAGASVATDVINAETDLRRARLELINAAIDVRIARARLDRAVGTAP